MPFLDWVNKNQAKQAAAGVPYHLLKFEAAYGDGSDNLLIQGDNLLALKALVPFYAGQVKCIFIDPPYNIQSAFKHYDDKLEHSQWLSLMYPRVQVLRELLARDGSIWITIDDHEAHYLKVLMDEVLGRDKLVANVVWQKRYSRENREAIGDVHDHILVYSADKEGFKRTRNLTPITAKQAKVYRNPNDDPKGRWRPIPMNAQGFRENQMYTITAPGGRRFKPPKGRCWSIIESEYARLLAEGRIYFGKDNNSQPNTIRYLNEVPGFVPWTWWPHDEAGHNDEAKKEINILFGTENAFDTPKPERLLRNIIGIATNPGDLVLDSFLGSGTTAAVAHKMGRRYIGIELGEHARTHCLPRLQKVVEGEQGGISELVEWKGGGGFRFHTLGEPVFEADGSINPGVRFAALASFIWHLETSQPASRNYSTPLLGTHKDVAYILLYNGILGDRRPQGGNVLTHAVLEQLKRDHPHDGPRVVYGETTRLGAQRLQAEGVTFKQIPYDVHTR